MSGGARRIVIPGGSGQVGMLLARHFHARGDAVTVLSRRPGAAPWRVVEWDGATEGEWVRELEGADVCINLSGRSVNCQYTVKNRAAIYDSRIGPTRLLNRVIGELERPPRVWLNSSTATIYRHSFDTANGEGNGVLGGDELGAPDSGPDSWNFSIRVAKDWEQEFLAKPCARVRKIAMRSAVTFSPGAGGVFDVLSTLVRRGAGGTQGSGKQMVSWVHGEDFVRAVEFLVGDERFEGVVNIASPNPLSNREFMRALREAWGVGVGLDTPAWLIEVGCFLLRTESELVLKSRYVVPGRLHEAGFEFLYPSWPEAARDLVKRARG